MAFGISAAIYSSLFIAISQVALKRSYKDLEPSVAFFVNALLGLLIWVPIALAFGIEVRQLAPSLLVAFLSGVVAEALWFFALSKGQLSITSVVLGSYPIYTIGFSYLINHERLTSQQLLFVSLTICGTLISYLPSKLRMRELRMSGAIVWPVLTAIAVGLSDTLSKSVITSGSLSTFLFCLGVVQIPVALLYLRIERRSPVDTARSMRADVDAYRLPLIGALFNVVGTGLLFVAFSNTLASIAAPIAGTSGALIALFCVIFLDEPLRAKNAAGLVAIVAGVFGVSRSVEQ